MPQSSPPPPHLRGTRLDHSWRLVTIAGALGSLYFSICVGGVPKTKFMTEMGATAWHFGVMSALGSLALASNLFCGAILEHLRVRKKIWMIISISHRLLFLLTLAAPALFVEPRWRLMWIIGATFVHDVFMHMGGPIWFSWMSDILPPGAANRYWGSRQRTITLLNIVSAAAIYLYLRHIESAGIVLPGLIALGIFGVVAGVVDILLFTPVPEPPYEPTLSSSIWKSMLEPIRDREFRPYLIFCCYWVFAAAFAYTFFLPYMIEVLKMPASTAQIVLTTAAFGMAFSSRIWGLLCDSYGMRPVLQLVVSFKSLIVVVFLLVPASPAIAIPVLAISFLLDGVLNSGFNLASMGLRLQATPRRNRTMYIATTTFLSAGIAGAISSYLGGQFIDWAKNLSEQWGPIHITGYHVAFGVSLVLRIGSIFMARGIRENRGMPVTTLLAHLIASNPVRVSALVYRLLESTQESRRARAARRLGDLRSPLAIGGLIGGLSDPSRTVRRACADALGRIGASEATEPLARILQDRALGIQSTAARALGNIAGDRSVQALLQNLRSLDQKSMEQAIDSLRRIGDPVAILPLVCILDEIGDNERLQRKITRALARLSTTQSAGEVQAMFRAERDRRTAAGRIA